jgi:hypothetical protein
MNIDSALVGLGGSSDTDKQRLGQLLWNWKLCGQCTTRASCSQTLCPWNRQNSLNAFWELFDSMTRAYKHEDIACNKAINSHSDVLDIIKSIKGDRTASQQQLLSKMFQSCGQAGQPPRPTEQKRAFDISAGVLLLMDFNVLHDLANVSGSIISPIPWRDEVSVDDFVKEAFHDETPPANVNRMLVEIKAKKLVKDAKIRLEPTNDLRRHMVLDQKEKVVWVFHQTTALREMLMSSDNDPASCILPRAMLLEVLETIRLVFFSDSGSRKLLKSLVSKHGWDAGLLSDLSIPYPKQSDAEVTYAYFGDRIEELHNELQNPTPHGWFEERLNRRSEMNMLKVTFIGALVAVTLTLFTLIIALFQAWVAWQQWKHPVKED